MNPERITELLKAKDKRAIEVLYDQYAPNLYGVVLKIVRSEEIAQDVMQDAFVKVWQKADQYDASKGTLFTWLLNIFRNKAIDKTRSKHFVNNTKTQNLPDFVYNDIQLSKSMNTDTIGVKSMVKKLEFKYQEIIELVYFQGYTQREIEEMLNIPLGTVKSRLRIGLRELRNLFEQKGI